MMGAITGTSVTSYFMAGLYEETDGVARKYYAISGMTVAMSDAEGMKYLLTDHLGSVAAITDDEGTLLDQQRYLPFGAERPNVGTISQTDFGYTGQRDLSSMGLMDYKARFYDSTLGRFIQPDSIIPNPADPQSWNRYSYGLNNPARYTDPTGHRVACGTMGDACEESAKEKILDKNNDLAERVGRDGFTDLDAFTQVLDYAGSLTPTCTQCLVNNVGGIYTGLDQGSYIIAEAMGRRSPYFSPTRLGQSDYASVFQDPPNAVAQGGGDQARHFWFFVQVGFESGESVSRIGVELHETVLGRPAGMSSEDRYLGYEGAKLGAALRAGTVSPAEVGGYVRNTLSPGSSAALYYEGLQAGVPVAPLYP